MSNKTFLNLMQNAKDEVTRIKANKEMALEALEVLNIARLSPTQHDLVRLAIQAVKRMNT